jgi:hypothetical protein
MKLNLTRGQIITEALETAGRPDLVSNARLWLNLFLEEFYMNQDVEWLQKSVELPVTGAVNFPDDYRGARSAIILRGSSEFIVPISSDVVQYDLLRKYNSAEGVPSFIYADHDLRQFLFVPMPSEAMTLKLKYYYLPEIPDHTDVETDSEIPKWEMPGAILIEHIKGMAHEYNDDERQQVSEQKVMNKISLAKMNNRDARAGTTKFPMGKSFRKR